MNLQIIKSVEGKDEYVLLPMHIYLSLQQQIAAKMKSKDFSDYVVFEPEDYVDNPIALARIKSGLTQGQLAKRMKVSQAYISKIETQEKVTAKLLHKVKNALRK
ncbi:MAG TPA: helix-turn-helix transcriptional regulator [Gammaproteobacteria bacterium]|nr:helix-turn-helix transcriptional regulator [Gammaproteobacteria bacterium]